MNKKSPLFFLVFGVCHYRLGGSVPIATLLVGIYLAPASQYLNYKHPILFFTHYDLIFTTLLHLRYRSK